MNTMIASIAAKTVGVDFKKAKEVAQNCYQIIGYATDVKSGEGSRGSWKILQGSFEATNVQTGEIFVSGRCFLPSTFTNIIAGQLQGSVGEVSFAYLIGTKPSDDLVNTAGYEWVVTPLVEAEATDPIEVIRSKIVKPVVVEPKKSK
jgi:hypothetical protein